MYDDLSNNFLTTYDPNYLEQHSDSSDFEDPCSPVSTPRNEYHRLRTKVHNSRSKEEKDTLNQQIFNRQIYSRVCCHSSRELWRTNAVLSQDTTEVDFQVRQRYQNVKTVRDEADQIDISQHRTVMRHKLIPCLSNMFRRSRNNVKQMSTIKENRAQNLQTDNGNHCGDCGCKVRKLNRGQQCYAAQPVHQARGSIYGAQIPFAQTKRTQSPLTNERPKRHGYYNEYDHDGAEHEIVQSNQKRKKWKKKESEMKKQYSRLRKNDAQHYPFRQTWRTPYQVFTTNPTTGQYPYQSNDVGCSAKCPESPEGTAMAETSSGFWEFLLDKFNAKSQTNRDDIPHLCRQNNPKTQSRGTPDYHDYNVQPETHYRQDQTSKESCNCSHSGLPGPTQPAKPIKLPKPPPPAKVKCMCSNKKAKPDPLPKKPVEPELSTPCHKCQQPHDQTLQEVAAKYNGEVLCIHNPPCILINGCLNLPPPKEKQYNVCSFAEEQTAYHGQASQYPPPTYNVHQCQIPEYRHEKIIQSLCSHTPPCEVVRTCAKTKYDPSLHNPCIHVPTCEKIAKCVMNKTHDRSTCPHKPKCLELPICTRHYIMLTATEEVGVQAKPGDLVCRHEPPCVMIPKCFAHILYDSCIPYDSIPDCLHRPMCEMIPACCRKSTKEMVSVASPH